MDATLGCQGLFQREGSSQCGSGPEEAPAHPHGLPVTVCLCLQQMDDAVYTFETLLHQELGKLQGKDDLCKSIQRILERVLKVRGSRSGALVTSGGLMSRSRVLGKRPGVTFLILIKFFWEKMSFY